MREQTTKAQVKEKKTQQKPQDNTHPLSPLPISNYMTQELGTVTKRWCKKNKQFTDQPKIIEEYDKHTGGVNLCYMLLDLYCVKTRQSQVPHTYIFYCIGISITNSWLLYQCHMQQQNISKKDKFTLLAFHTEISDNRQSKNDLNDVTRP